ncbi:MAG: hypothetical protein ACK5BN_06250 [Planctomycetota bacterium]
MSPLSSSPAPRPGGSTANEILGDGGFSTRTLSVRVGGATSSTSDVEGTSIVPWVASGSARSGNCNVTG